MIPDFGISPTYLHLPLVSDICYAMDHKLILGCDIENHNIRNLNIIRKKGYSILNGLAELSINKASGMGKLIARVQGGQVFIRARLGSRFTWKVGSQRSVGKT
jgi:hypothetical protein